MSEEKDARKRSKQEYIIDDAKVVGGKRSKTKKGRERYTTVVEKPTPTKDKPYDTRLYKGEGVSARPSTAQAISELKARYKSTSTPADSLTRAEFSEFKKNKPKKKKRLRKKRK